MAVNGGRGRLRALLARADAGVLFLAVTVGAAFVFTLAWVWYAH
jgi:hypothetical protein